MTDDTIRAALDAAWRAECIARAEANNCIPEPCKRACKWCAAGSAAAIAAFHKRLAGRHNLGRVGIFTNDELAALIEEAARHE